MVKTELTPTERQALIDRIAQWATQLGIGSLVAFMFECNQPVAPLSGNAFIAMGPLAQPLVPIPLMDVGLLLLDPLAPADIRRRIEAIHSEETA